MHNQRATPTTFLLSLTLLVWLGQAQAAHVLTANYSPDRNNANLNEVSLNPASVNPSAFGKLYAHPVDGYIYAQPLYVHGVKIGRRYRSIVYVATMHNSVYAFDADRSPDTAVLWRVTLGPSVPNEYYNFNDIIPEVGILSTPVIDRASGTIYVVANTLDNGRSVYRLHALDIRYGWEKPGSPVVIQASVPGTASDGQNGSVTFQADDQLQRPGLLLLNEVVYLAFGSHGDGLPYHGWILGYDAKSLAQVTAFNVTPNGEGGSIWQGGHGLTADADGNLYAVTANGDFDGTSNWSEAFLKFNTKGGLSIADWFTPAYWSTMNDVDMEVGTSGAILIPGTDLVAGGGKLGFLYLLHRSGMGGLTPTDSPIVQKFQAVNFGFFSIAFWNNSNTPTVYVSGWNDVLKAYRMVNGQFDTTPASQTSSVYANPYPGMAISANGGKDGTGILWVTTSDQTGQPVPGTLHAFDASDLSRELWNSDMNPARDQLGNLAKFATPTVVDGKVYVPTFSNQLAVYGLLPVSGPVAPQRAAPGGLYAN